jgi:hypothetical protein
MMTIKRTPNEIGDDFAKRVVTELDGNEVKQSGGGSFWKLDVRGGMRFVLSLKATTKRTFTVTPEMVREAKRAACGPVGSGDGSRWAIGVEIDGEAVILTSLEDWADMQRAEPAERPIRASKAAERRAKVGRSPLSRSG